MRCPVPRDELPREQWSRTRVALGARGRAFDWKAAFGRDAPHVVDLGCGNGRFLISSAIRRPEIDHLGIDLVPPAVKFASLRAGQRGLTNCKIAWGDANEFLLERCLPASIDEAHLYHPQPYFDPARASQRQLSPALLLALHRALVPGGKFVFQTDNAAFARYAHEVGSTMFEWREQDGVWPDAPAGRTLREITARKLGFAIVRVLARRLDLSPEEAARRAASLPEPSFDANRPAFQQGSGGHRSGGPQQQRGGRAGGKGGDRGGGAHGRTDRGSRQGGGPRGS